MRRDGGRMLQLQSAVKDRPRCYTLRWCWEHAMQARVLHMGKNLGRPFQNDHGIATREAIELVNQNGPSTKNKQMRVKNGVEETLISECMLNSCKPLGHGCAGDATVLVEAAHPCPHGLPHNYPCPPVLLYWLSSFSKVRSR